MVGVGSWSGGARGRVGSPVWGSSPGGAVDHPGKAPQRGCGQPGALRSRLGYASPPGDPAPDRVGQARAGCPGSPWDPGQSRVGLAHPDREGAPGTRQRTGRLLGARVSKVRWWSPATSAETRGNEREPSDWPGHLAGCRLAGCRLAPGRRLPGHRPPGRRLPGRRLPGHLAPGHLAGWRLAPGHPAGVGPGLCSRHGCCPCRRCGGGMLGGWGADGGWGRGPGAGHWGAERLGDRRLGSCRDVDHLGHGGVGRLGQDGGLHGRGPWWRGGCDGAGAGAVPVPGGGMSGPVRAESP
jgi:hypothetical protein